MTPGTLQLDAHEQRGDSPGRPICGRLSILADQGVEDHLRVLLDLALDRQDLTGDLRPRPPLGQFLADPVPQCPCLAVRLAAGIAAGGQLWWTNPVTPGASELPAKIRLGQQRVNQFGPAVRILVIQVLRRLLGRGNSAGQVQADPPQESRVITEPDGLCLLYTSPSPRD